jgi:hypothetical protein
MKGLYIFLIEMFSITCENDLKFIIKRLSLCPLLFFPSLMKVVKIKKKSLY